MGSVPPAKKESAHVALPAVRVSDWHPAMAVPLSVNDTVPPPSVGLTVAVNVTDWFCADGFTDEVTVTRPVEPTTFTAVAGLHGPNEDPNDALLNCGSCVAEDQEG